MTQSPSSGSLFNKFLHIISTNSKLTSKQISKELQTSQQNVSYMIKKCRDDNVISQYQTLIDPSRFGFDSFIVMLKLKNSSKKTFNDLNRSIEHIPEITGYYSLFGSFEVVLKFTTYNASSFNKTLKLFLSEIKEIVIDVVIFTQIVEYYFSPTYISTKRIRESVLLGADRERIRVSDKEKEILHFLDDNSRVSSSKIALSLSTTAKSVIENIKKLEKKEIIKGYSAIYHPELLDINQYLVLLKVSFEQDESVVIKHIKTIKNITRISKVFGSWDIIIQFETFNALELREFLQSIKEEFEILDYSYTTITRRYFWKTIPNLKQMDVDN